MSNIERIHCGNGNAYIVSEGENAILVDTCRTQYRDMILEKCRAKKIRLIVLTHGHIDHMQNAAYLSKGLDVPIAMHEADFALVRDNLAEPMYAETLLGKIILSLSQKSFAADIAEPFAPGLYLKDGDTLGEYGVPATVIALPGHTKGSIGLLVGDADLIVGDALMNMSWPTKSPLYGDKARMEQSAAKISAAGTVTIHFGHGKPVKNRNW
jgi:glyoxylase-like metal-dependent hydrolase (beta-lactamase superfamily II)